jgi:hypothetical protein
MHIAVIGATAFILFVMIGGLFMAAVVLEQRTRRKLAQAEAASVQAEANPTPVAPIPAPKAMGAAAGRWVAARFRFNSSDAAGWRMMSSICALGHNRSVMLDNDFGCNKHQSSTSMIVGLEIAALFVLLPIAFILRPRRPQPVSHVDVGEAAFFSLPPQLRLMLDEFAIPTTVRNGVVSVELAPDAWKLLLEVTDHQPTRPTAELRRA